MGLPLVGGFKICPHIQPPRSSPRLPLWEAKHNGKLGGGTMSKMIKILISKLCRKREILNFGFFKFTLILWAINIFS